MNVKRANFYIGARTGTLIFCVCVGWLADLIWTPSSTTNPWLLCLFLLGGLWLTAVTMVFYYFDVLFLFIPQDEQETSKLLQYYVNNFLSINIIKMLPKFRGVVSNPSSHPKIFIYSPIFINFYRYIALNRHPFRLGRSCFKICV